MSKGHTIIPNGYDLGRDLLVKAATTGGSFADRTWKASVEYADSLLRAGAWGMSALRPFSHAGINHNISIDGRVAVLTVRKTPIGH